MTEPSRNLASLLAPFIAALLLAIVVTGLGHVVLHLRPQTDMALGVIVFAVSAAGLLAIRGLKMDTSYTL